MNWSTMRIQILIDCYLPSSTSGAKLIDDLARAFTHRGHQVSLAVPDDTLDKPIRIERDGDLTVLRVRSGPLKGAGRVRRAISEARLSTVIWNRARGYFESHPADLVVSYSPSIFFGRLVSELKKLWNCPSYLILRDIFPRWAVDAGVMGKGPAYWYFRRVEKQQYAAADFVGVQSPANLRYFEEEGLADQLQLEVLYNWMDTRQPLPAASGYRTAWGLQEKTLLFFGGNLGVAQDVGNLLRLAERIRSNSNAHLLLVGDGSEVPWLTTEIERRGLTNVTLKPALDQEGYFALLRECDIGLISLSRDLRTQNIPGKLLGYLRAGLPVLASINPGNDLQQLLEDHDAGVAVLNGHDDELTTAANLLIRDDELRTRLGHNGQRLLKDVFSVEAAADQIISKVESPQQFQPRIRAA